MKHLLNKHITSLSFFLFFLPVCIVAQTQFVDPFIGTGGHGHTYPGATMPFGMVQLSPDTRLDGWDGCGGYHYSDSLIYGFSHTHLSGTGVSDYGDILVMPSIGKPSFNNSEYASHFSHANEKASPGYYSVKLDKDHIQAELTATTRVGFHKYTFPKTNDAWMLFDLIHRDKVTESAMTIVSNKEVEGFRRSEAWAKDQVVYFVAEFSKPFDSFIMKHDDKLTKVKMDSLKTKLSENSKNIQTYFHFVTNQGEALLVKVGISAVSIEGARENLHAELNNWDFEKVRREADRAWGDELSKIKVEGGTPEQLKIFYTSLYHTLIVPNVFMDVDGQYRGMDKKIHTAQGFTYYSVFSLWDTFRAADPLYTIIEPKRSLDFIKTFLAQYDQGGRLPVWELASNETDCMIGYHAVSVITDAVCKGITDFDQQKAFEAMKKSATWDHFGLSAYMDHGFLEMEDEHESVSKTLEYAYDDWCIAQMAKKLGYQSDYEYYIHRAQNYKNVFDPVSTFMRPKKNGNWFSPFDPREVNNSYTEANSWQYTFFVPQDISGLINLMGGEKKFELKLDELFSTETKTTGRSQADITGLVGQYAHGNEPSHHMAYLYDYVHKPSKTQQRISQLLTTMYHADPDGLIGNEDCGQMSAWYVLSALGIYAVTPGIPQYEIGSPIFKEVKISLDNKKVFTIKADHVSPQACYIQSMSLNNMEYKKMFLNHEDLLKGGELTFEMGTKMNDDVFEAPISSIKEKEYISVPVLNALSQSFRDSMLISIQNYNPGTFVYYTLDGKEPNEKSIMYSKPFYIHNNTTLKAKSIFKDSNGNNESYIATGKYYKIPNNWTISIASNYNPQYTAGGPNGIIDGIRGDVNWRKGEWQGYQGQDFEAVIDLGKTQAITKLGAGFLQDTRAWILMPKRIEFEISTDGKNFTKALQLQNTLADSNLTPQVKDYSGTVKGKTARYIKVKAFNYGKLPEWHEGKGGEAYIFIDEIFIE